MLLNILATLVSLLPLTFIYLWLKNKLKDDEAYRSECKSPRKMKLISQYAKKPSEEGCSLSFG